MRSVLHKQHMPKRNTEPWPVSSCRFGVMLMSIWIALMMVWCRVFPLRAIYPDPQRASRPWPLSRLRTIESLWWIKPWLHNFIWTLTRQWMLLNDLVLFQWYQIISKNMQVMFECNALVTHCADYHFSFDSHRLVFRFWLLTISSFLTCFAFVNLEIVFQTDR